MKNLEGYLGTLNKCVRCGKATRSMATYTLDLGSTSITIYSITPESPPTAKYIHLSLYGYDFEFNAHEGLASAAAAAAGDC